MAKHNELNPGKLAVIDINQIDILDQPMPEQNAEEKRDLMESIRENGLTYPIVVQKQDDGRYKVIDGRTRLEVVKKLEYSQIPCILRDGEEPIGDLLSYELEIYRRQLNTVDKSRLTKEYFTKKNSATASLYDSIEKKLCAEMKQLFKAKQEEEMSKDLRLLFWFISRLPKSDQLSFVKTNSADSPEQEMLANEMIDNMQDKLDEYEAEIKRLKHTEVALAKVKTEFKERSDAAIKAKIVELEEKYKDDSDLSDVIADARKQAAADFEKDIVEMNMKLQEVSKAKDKLQIEADYEKNKYKQLEQDLRQTETLSRTRKAQLDHSDNVIRGLANTQKVPKQLQIAHDDIHSAYQSMVTAGIEVFNGDEKKVIAGCLNKIKDVISMTEDFLETKAKTKKAA